MPPDSWPRIAGLHYQRDGKVAVVWCAHEKAKDLVHVFDATVFPRDLPIVITHALRGRGKTIPVAWSKGQKEFADQLLECGVSMTVDPVQDTDMALEAISRDVWGRMRSERLKVARHLTAWLDEYQSFGREDNKIPRDSHPLMIATMNAVASLAEARAPQPEGIKRNNYPKVAII
jgi:hypothetical protein